MTFDLVMWPLTLSCDLQVRHNVKVPIVHLWSKFGYNWSEPVRTGAIWKRLTKTLTDARTNGHTEFGSLCVSTNIRSGDSFRRHKNGIWIATQIIAIICVCVNPPIIAYSLLVCHDKTFLINSSKKVRKLKFHRSYFSYYHTSNMVFDIIREPVYLSLNWYHICNGYEIMVSKLQLVLIESQKWNLAKHCVLAIVQDSLQDENNRSFPARQH